tara:strand:+ start:52 stop:249 length:198 start_codon:yes stop_codon:yes gene_type:complete
MFNFRPTTLRQSNTTPQVAVRRQGFGGHFVDTPPPFIQETKEDNKIERINKPTKKKRKKRKNKKK